MKQIVIHVMVVARRQHNGCFNANKGCMKVCVTLLFHCVSTVSLYYYLAVLSRGLVHFI